MTIQSIAVIGAGTMGAGIAYACSAVGLDVTVHDADTATAHSAPSRIAALYDGAIARGKASPDARTAGIARIRMASDLPDAVHTTDIVIEAVPESIELKQSIFAEVERHAAPRAVFATNTSSLPISTIAERLSDPGRVVGMHFFNPVAAMRLVELVRGTATRDETLATAEQLVARLGKTSIVVRDTPGFATSRLGVVLGLEAIRMLEQGVANAEDIDRAMALGYNHPMGPLRLTDLVGLDVRLAVAEHLHATLGADTYRPPDLLRRMVAEGRIGRKAGRGFFDWSDET